MSSLFSAINESGNTRTWNGMKTNATSENSAVDLFYKWGGSRGKFAEITASLAGAIAQDKDVAIRILLWGRDARSGAGERQLFKDSIDFLAENEMLTTQEAIRVMNRIPEIGRWDDLSIFVDTVLENTALTWWVDSIHGGDGLAAKWAPRKGVIAAKMRKISDMSPKAYRKMLVANTNVVETAMCSGNWSEINFSHVPSVAAARLQKAFFKHVPMEYGAYKESLVKGDDPKVKINATAVYPYDIVKSLREGDRGVANAQWNALPDYMDVSEGTGIFPMIDTSGSMYSPVGGYRSGSSITCMDVAISLGLYISERNKGIFQDEFLTFSGSPEIQKTKGTLAERYLQMNDARWGMNTNIIRAFEVMLDSAMRANLPEAEMPKTLLIISDMQFDNCARFDDSAMQSITRQYRNAGYERPNIVFWNVNTGDGVPVKHNALGVALVSGFSPSIMASVMNAEEMSPNAMMLKTVMNTRYDW